MAKGKNTIFFCQNCGYESPKWLGQCPGCREWNTFVEEPVAPKSTSGAGGSWLALSGISIGGADTIKRTAGGSGTATAGKVGRIIDTDKAGANRTGNAGGKDTVGSRTAGSFRNTPTPVSLSRVEMSGQKRFSTGIGELDRVLGGGIVPGSLVLVGGDPGIGKSTLLLQVCRNLSAAGRSVLYISGEESLQQIRIRAERIGSFSDSLKLLCETNLENVANVLQREQPEVAIIDSVQTMYSENASSAPGSVSQIRQATGLFLQLAKLLNITIFLVGHVTKEGVVAGPRVLEHMVDSVLYFEGDRHAAYRVLRGVKNRFGSTNEIGVFEMRGEGLVEVPNPSEYMLSGRPEGASGSVVACSIEGTRPILVEIQALICKTGFGLPRRTAAGADLNRVNLLLAVLEKRAGIHLSSSDAYVNIAGGVRMNEPAIDLGIVLAVVSSYKDIPISDRTICFGEVGLSGEVRSVSMALTRVQEAKKLGFERCILPKVCVTEQMKGIGIEIVGVGSVREAIGCVMRSVRLS